jgi:outer membrane biosynthesis protein TonB
MREAVSEVIALRSTVPADLSRLVRWSLSIHVTLLVIALAWQAWRAGSHRDDVVMTISLSGSLGPDNGGLTPIGGRHLDEPATPPVRPEPTPALAREANTTSLPTKSTTKPPPQPRSSVASPSSVVRPPAVSEVRAGSSVVDTSARGEGPGLATGGGTNAAVDDAQFLFCCRDYLNLMQTEINRHVNWQIESHGTVVIQFEIQRDGSIVRDGVEVKQSSRIGALDLNAQFAVRNSRLQPLPREYAGKSLIVRLTVPY